MALIYKNGKYYETDSQGKLIPFDPVAQLGTQYGNITPTTSVPKTTIPFDSVAAKGLEYGNLGGVGLSVPATVPTTMPEPDKAVPLSNDIIPGSVADLMSKGYTYEQIKDMWKTPTEQGLTYGNITPVKNVPRTTVPFDPVAAQGLQYRNIAPVTTVPTTPVVAPIETPITPVVAPVTTPITTDPNAAYLEQLMALFGSLGQTSQGTNEKFLPSTSTSELS